MTQRPNYKLDWNRKTRSFVVPISKKRVAKLVAASRWDGAQLSQALRNKFGDWLQPGVAFGPLHDVKNIPWESESPTRRALVNDEVFGALCKARDRVDALLGRWLPLVETAVRGGEGLAVVSAEIVAEVVRETDADDRWFSEVVEILALCFHVLQSDVDDDELESIADGVFSSWIAPPRDAVLRFADEMAALGMRSQFQARYGGPDTDPAS